MIVQGEKLKNAVKKEGLAALCSLGPRVRCQFDNGQEFFAGKTGNSFFSWRAKGDFTLPVLPLTVGILATAVTLSCLFPTQNSK